MELADETGLDLVEVAPDAEPPVCKLLDFGKYKYEAQKKASEARKKQKTIDIKEVKFRPGINAADYDVKLRNIRRLPRRRRQGQGDHAFSGAARWCTRTSA